jgi:hypothetical protein
MSDSIIIKEIIFCQQCLVFNRFFLSVKCAKLLLFHPKFNVIGCKERRICLSSCLNSVGFFEGGTNLQMKVFKGQIQSTSTRQPILIYSFSLAKNHPPLSLSHSLSHTHTLTYTLSFTSQH